MHWWRSPFSSPSSSSSPKSTVDTHQTRDASDINVIGDRRGSHPQRRLTRQRKLRYLSDRDVGRLPLNIQFDPAPLQNSTSGPSARSPSLSPQPLPLPWDCPLPSPKKAVGQGKEEDRGRTSSIGNGTGARPLLNSAVRRKVQNNFWLNVPANSAPTSGLSSPACSFQKLISGHFSSSSFMAFQGFQDWSGPEFTALDKLTGFSSQILSEKTMSSPDHSLLHSPTVKSPGLNPRNPSGATSPLHHKLCPECSTPWHESDRVTVHVLPLPPGAVTSQPAFVQQTAAKLEASSLTSRWQKGKLIGRGTFGCVYVAKNRETGDLCAMKEVNLIPDDPKSAECIKQLEQEIKVLSQLKHPNIVQYYGSEIIEDHFYIYLEYVQPGSINKYIHQHYGALTEPVVRNFTRHILSGLAYLHSKKTIHRDIKGANLLVDKSGVVKLADFGMAKLLSGQAADLSLKGSPYWMAPEVIQAGVQEDTNCDLALAVDIWSLGCTIIEMLNGKPPWSELEGPAAMYRVLIESPPIPETLSPEGKDFLQYCFRRNPAERPSASMLLKHQFLRTSLHLDVPACTQAFSGMKLVSSLKHQTNRFLP